MSPRRNRPRLGGTPAQAEDEPTGGYESYETGPDGAWVVRRLSGAGSTKPYRCPGCDHEIAPGVPHVVVWPADGGPDDRRHWHTPCWNARLRRHASGRGLRRR